MEKLKDKRVGIIGTGATSVQCVPHLAKACKALYVFQRTPSSVDVRNNAPTDPDWFTKIATGGWQQRWLENFTANQTGGSAEEDLVMDGWTDLSRRVRAKIMTLPPEKMTPENMMAAFEDSDFEKMEQIRARVNSIVQDDHTAEKLKAWYRQLCKRPCFHDEYLQAYNEPDNYLIDTDYGVIVDVEATRSIRQAEVGSTKTMLDRVKDKFDLDPDWLIADTAYGSGPMLGWLVDRSIAPHIPVIDKAGRTDGTWSRADFEWDPKNNQYICPEGEPLKQFRRNYSDPNRGPTGKGVARYRALKETCQTCPSKNNCCPKADARKITREEHEDARDVARAIRNTPQYKVSSKLRKKVEMLFAHLKRILGLGRLRLRGPCGANDEFLLAATAQNLRKLAKIFPAPQQLVKA
jgi:hypothetical protein